MSDDLGDEATAILETCTRETAPALVAWAMGVRVLGHAMHFYRLPPQPRHVSPIMSGGSVGRSGRWYEATAARAMVYSGADGGGRDVHASVTWQQVCDLVTAARVGPDLHGRIVDAMNRRRAATRNPVPWRLAQDDDERDAQAAADALFSEIEQECADLADEVWDRCRPLRVEQVVQLDLLEGLL